jgi:hypothetical protein
MVRLAISSTEIVPTGYLQSFVYDELAEFEANRAAIWAQGYCGYVALGYGEAARICWEGYRSSIKWALWYSAQALQETIAQELERVIG